MMYNKTALYFAPLRFIRQEWSAAPSIFNIKAQELAPNGKNAVVCPVTLQLRYIVHSKKFQVQLRNQKYLV